MSGLLSFLAVALLLCSCISSSLAAQSQCNTGMGMYPCPSVSSSQFMYGLTWRNYSAVGIVGKGIFNPPTMILETINQGYPVDQQYFNGTNGAKMMIPRTTPVGVLMEKSGNQTAYMVIFFLPDELIKNPPAFTNDTGFLHLNSWPVPGATFNPIVYSFLNQATNQNIQQNLDLLTATLNMYKLPYSTGMTGYVTFSPPGSTVQQNEVWVFQEAPFPGHTLTSLINMANKKASME